MFLAQVQYVR